MKLSDLQKWFIWYRDKEITFLVDWKEYKIEYIDSTKIVNKLTFWLILNK